MATAARCACLSTVDGRTCFELRYYGHSPAAENDPAELGDWATLPEVCECPCHDDWEEDGDEYGWDEAAHGDYPWGYSAWD